MDVKHRSKQLPLLRTKIRRLDNDQWWVHTLAVSNTFDVWWWTYHICWPYHQCWRLNTAPIWLHVIQMSISNFNILAVSSKKTRFSVNIRCLLFDRDLSHSHNISKAYLAWLSNARKEATALGLTHHWWNTPRSISSAIEWAIWMRFFWVRHWGNWSTPTLICPA